MNEIYYASISRLEESYQHNPACADVVMHDGAYNRILQISKTERDLKEILDLSGVQKLFIGKVRKILNRKNEEPQ